MTQHTPGPWSVHPADDRAVARGSYLVAQGCRTHEDAHLIAAAPDLLSIARRWAALDGGAWHPERYATERLELMADTRAVISKAEAAFVPGLDRTTGHETQPQNKGSNP